MDIHNSELRMEDELNYIFHLKRDTFKLDEDDTEYYYCKYCKKKMKLRYFNRPL